MSEAPVPVLAGAARPPNIAVVVPAELIGLVRAALTSQRMQLRKLPDHVGAPARYMVTREDLSVELTDREREVLLLLTTGATNESIARSLFLSPATVGSHLKTLFR
jgi:DNA-binding NarL/FixJ family response regulator